MGLSDTEEQQVRDLLAHARTGTLPPGWQDAVSRAVGERVEPVASAAYRAEAAADDAAVQAATAAVIAVEAAEDAEDAAAVAEDAAAEAEDAADDADDAADDAEDAEDDAADAASEVGEVVAVEPVPVADEAPAERGPWWNRRIGGSR